MKSQIFALQFCNPYGEFEFLNFILGSMYDWSNYWARGIRCRQSVRPDIPYAGFFSQLGQLHTIYHIW